MNLHFLFNNESSTDKQLNIVAVSSGVQGRCPR